MLAEAKTASISIDAAAHMRRATHAEVSGDHRSPSISHEVAVREVVCLTDGTAQTK